MTKIKKRNGKNIWPLLFLLPYFIFYALFFVYPTIYSFVISLTNWDSLAGISKRSFVAFANYIRLFSRDRLFFQSLGNTVLFMVIYIPIVIIGGLLLALMLYRLNKSRRLFQSVNILPYITTPVAIGIMFSFMFDWSTGIVNNILIHSGIIETGINWLGAPATARLVVILLIVWKNLGYYLIIYLAALTTVPDDVLEAASIDGASKVQSFLKITLPLLRPITVFLVLTSVISGFQLFDEPYLLFSNTGSSALGGPDRSCLTSMMYFFDSTFKSSTKLGYGATISYTLFLFIVVTSLILNKIFNRKETD
jgi:multiple sugar transport system permease protein/cellobiose transport system permease protein